MAKAFGGFLAVLVLLALGAGVLLYIGYNVDAPQSEVEKVISDDRFPR